MGPWSPSRWWLSRPPHNLHRPLHPPTRIPSSSRHSSRKPEHPLWGGNSGQGPLLSGNVESKLGCGRSAADGGGDSLSIRVGNAVPYNIAQRRLDEEMIFEQKPGECEGASTQVSGGRAGQWRKQHTLGIQDTKGDRCGLGRAGEEGVVEGLLTSSQFLPVGRRTCFFSGPKVQSPSEG